MADDGSKNSIKSNITTKINKSKNTPQSIEKRKRVVAAILAQKKK